MRFRNLLPALLLLLSPAALNAEVLAVCGVSAGYSKAALSAPLVEPEAAVAAPLALWRDAKGFDLLFNWGGQNQHSLRAEGADILGNELGNELVHLVVVRAGAHELEHFLFSFENDSSGELIWNGPDSTPGAHNEALSYEAVCVKPN